MNKGTGTEQHSMDMGGFWSAVVSFGIWGMLPLYWKQLQDVPSLEILANRVWWCFIFVGIFTVLVKKTALIGELFRTWKKTLFVLLKSLILGANWFIFVWAVNSGRVVESSLGYYINPLLSVLLAMIFLKERLKKMQYVAFFIALAGVLIMTLNYGRFPWVSFLLAFSFGLYGLLKKIVPVDAQVGMLAETFFIAPVALVYIILGKISGTSSLFAGEPRDTFFLVTAGVVTAFPLIFFNYAVKKIPFTVVGFIQYLAPTGMLLLGVFMFHEPFDSIKLFCFIMIWIALAIFTVSQFRKSA